jgi:hypothetical protein
MFMAAELQASQKQSGWVFQDYFMIKAPIFIKSLKIRDILPEIPEWLNVKNTVFIKPDGQASFQKDNIHYQLYRIGIFKRCPVPGINYVFLGRFAPQKGYTYPGSRVEF